MSFHYTDPFFDGEFGAGLVPPALAHSPLWILMDIAILLPVLLISGGKFFIALFLLWLLVDLFILKAFARTELGVVWIF